MPRLALVESADRAELFLYPRKEHLFADSSLSVYDAAATALLTRARAEAFLDAVQRGERSSEDWTRARA